MKLSPRSRRIALIAFIVALLAMLAVGFYLAATHQETRPDAAPATTAAVKPTISRDRAGGSIRPSRGPLYGVTGRALSTVLQRLTRSGWPLVEPAANYPQSTLKALDV